MSHWVVVANHEATGAKPRSTHEGRVKTTVGTAESMSDGILALIHWRLARLAGIATNHRPDGQAATVGDATTADPALGATRTAQALRAFTRRTGRGPRMLRCNPAPALRE